MKNHSNFLHIILLLIVFTTFPLSSNIYAQEIKANVTVNYELIPQDRREDILTMQDDVLRYLNNQKFLDTEWKGEKIDIDVVITLMARNGNSYDAKLVFMSKRALDSSSSVALRFLDDKWTFQYQRNAVLTYQSNRFDAFSSLLDYYVFIALGTDLDTYGELDGTPMFQQAQRLFQLGSSNSEKGYQISQQPGEYSRYNFIIDALDPRIEPFRKQIFSYYVDGISQMKSNRSAAMQNVDGILTEMVKFKNDLGKTSMFMSVFFDAKYQELAEIFRGQKNEQAFQKLRYLDPGHASLYEAAQNSR